MSARMLYESDFKDVHGNLLPEGARVRSVDGRMGRVLLREYGVSTGMARVYVKWDDCDRWGDHSSEMVYQVERITE
jgi:hypothetical protein